MMHMDMLMTYTRHHSLRATVMLHDNVVAMLTHRECHMVLLIKGSIVVATPFPLDDS